MRIGELRKLLNDWEAKHTPEDDKIIGKFEDQEIYVPTFKWNRAERYDPTGSFDYQGMGRDLVVYWDVTGLGLFIDHE